MMGEYQKIRTVEVNRQSVSLQLTLISKENSD